MALYDFDWSNSFKLEMKCANIVSQQAKHGTQFNTQRAQWCIHSLSEKIVLIDKVMIPLLPEMLNKGTSYKKPFKLNGDFSKYPGEYAASVGLERSEVGGPFTAVWYTPFDPSKADRVKKVMLDFGWFPTEWNTKKMPLDVWGYRKRLERAGFTKFMQSLPREEREGYEALLNGFVERHFHNQSKPYMQTILATIGFKKNKSVTFGDIKKKLLLNPYWPTSPKITEDSFESVGEENGLVMQLLKERMVWSHRRSLLQGLVEQVRCDGKIEAQMNPCATPTARARHRIVVNIPAAYATFGKQCRSLFTGDKNPESKYVIFRKELKQGVRVKPNTNLLQKWDEEKEKWKDDGVYRTYIPNGYDVFVGADGAGLELRMLTHYLIYISKTLLDEAREDDDVNGIAKYEDALRSAYEYREQVLHGDIHTHNQKLAGLPTRSAAKTFVYAFLYGAGDANLGAQLGGGKEVGAEIRARFLKECPCIDVLIEWAQGFAGKNGWLPGIDGRKLLMRQEEDGSVSVRRALNLLLQAAGSIVMKCSLCFMDGWVKKDNLRCKQVIFYHKSLW